MFSRCFGSKSLGMPPRCRSRSTRSSSSAVPLAVWEITHSLRQPPRENFEVTHERALPLPFAVDLHTATGKLACIYIGHGHSKTTFLIEGHSRVLKLTAASDQEPDVSQTLAQRCRTVAPDAKICPDIYEVQANVREYDGGGKLCGQSQKSLSDLEARKSPVYRGTHVEASTA